MTDRPIKILYICHDAQYYGAQQSLRLILKHLPETGVECHVSVARSGPLEDELAKAGQVILHEHDRLQWVKHDERGFFQKIMDILTLVGQTLWRPWQLASIIRQHGIDLVHTNSAVSLEGAIAAKLAGVPHVWHMREIFMADNPKFQPVLGKTITRRMIEALSDRVICISGAVQSQFGSSVQKQPEKFPVIYNAVSLPKTMPSIEKETTGAFRIGYVGRLSAGKRFHDLLEAVRILKTQKLEPEVLVAGTFVDTPYERRVQETISQYRLNKQVKMLGYVDDPVALYKNIDVLVVPSLNEPFGRVLIEAMTYGTLCIASDSGGVPEIITNGETGLLYPPRDTRALAVLLVKVMQHPKETRPLRDNAQRMVRTRFNIDAQLGQLLRCYHEARLQHQDPSGARLKPRNAEVD